MIFMKMFSIFTVNPILLKLFYGFVTLWTIKYLFNFIERLWRLPPGPWGLPFVGYLPFLKNDTYLHFLELAKRYGSTFSFKCGSCDLVVLNEAKVIHEALANDHLLARADLLFIGSDGAASIFEMSGDTWKEQRRVTLTLFRNLGLGKSILEEKVKEEINSFIEFIKESDGKRFDFSASIGASVANIISILLFGHASEYNDPDAVKIRTSSAAVAAETHFFSAGVYLPLYYKIVSLFKFLKTNVNKTLEDIRQVEAIILKEVAEHKEKGAAHEVGDYIDGFLLEMDKQKDKKNSSFNLDILKRNVVDFYSAGADTTSISLSWIMLFLIAHPEHQKRIRTEILKVVGSDRQPDYSDRLQMPFTMAFISEALRVSSVVPINILRRATQDVIIGGIKMPKDTLVVTNFWSVHYDPNLWEDPESFKPERFLNADGTEFLKSPNLIPFSEGKRACPGAGLAWMELFLYLTRIVQKFEIKPAKGMRASKSFEAKFTFFRYPSQPIELDFCSLE